MTFLNFTPNTAPLTVTLIQVLKDFLGSRVGGDQGVLNAYWANKWNRLSFVFNVTSSAFYSYAPALKHFRPTIRIVHFAGPHKPWLTQNGQESGVTGEFFQLWLQAHLALLQQQQKDAPSHTPEHSDCKTNSHKTNNTQQAYCTSYRCYWEEDVKAGKILTERQKQRNTLKLLCDLSRDRDDRYYWAEGDEAAAERFRTALRLLEESDEKDLPESRKDSKAGF